MSAIAHSTPRCLVEHPTSAYNLIYSSDQTNEPFPQHGNVVLLIPGEVDDDERRGRFQRSYEVLKPFTATVVAIDVYQSTQALVRVGHTHSGRKISIAVKYNSIANFQWSVMRVKVAVWWACGFLRSDNADERTGTEMSGKGNFWELSDRMQRAGVEPNSAGV